MAEKRKYSKKYRRNTEAKIEIMDYKDTSMLKYCLSERFKIMPRRLKNKKKKYQEMCERAIQRARQAALIPYIVDRNEVVTNPFEGM